VDTHPKTGYTMPFCRDCGKEIQEDWKSCPYCSCVVGATTEQKVSVEDSVIMGNVGDITNIHVAENKNIHNHMLTMIDAIREGRDERAKEIFEIAKKINHSLAVNLHNVEYKEQIIDAKVDSLINYWETNLKGKAPKRLDQVELLMLFIPFIEVAKDRAFSLIEERPEALDVYVLLGEIGIEYRGLKISNHGGGNISIWAASKLRKYGSKEAATLTRKFERTKQGDYEYNLLLFAGIVVLGFILLVMFSFI